MPPAQEPIEQGFRCAARQRENVASQSNVHYCHLHFSKLNLIESNWFLNARNAFRFIGFQNETLLRLRPSELKDPKNIAPHMQAPRFQLLMMRTPFWPKRKRLVETRERSLVWFSLTFQLPMLIILSLNCIKKLIGKLNV